MSQISAPVWVHIFLTLWHHHEHFEYMMSIIYINTSLTNYSIRRLYCMLLLLLIMYQWNIRGGNVLFFFNPHYHICISGGRLSNMIWHHKMFVLPPPQKKKKEKKKKYKWMLVRTRYRICYRLQIKYGSSTFIWFALGGRAIFNI